MKKALVIQTAFIGDAILATALVHSLYALGYSCHVLVRQGNAVFFENHSMVDKTLVWNKKGFVNKYRNLLVLQRSVKKERYDLAINLQRFAATGWISTFSRSKITIGFSNNPWSRFYTFKRRHRVQEGLHECHRNLELLQLLHPEAQFHPPNLALTTAHLQAVNAYKHEPYVCIYPGSVWFSKRLSVNKWKELVDQMPASLNIYLLGAQNDEQIAQEIIAESLHKRAISLCGKLNIMESAALGKDAKMNYCNDSSPVHFLSAVNANISAFFLSTAPHYGFYPISQKSFVQEVKQLACKPCGMVGKSACPKGHFNCNKLLIPKTLLD